MKIIESNKLPDWAKDLNRLTKFMDYQFKGLPPALVTELKKDFAANDHQCHNSCSKMLALMNNGQKALAEETLALILKNH